MTLWAHVTNAQHEPQPGCQDSLGVQDEQAEQGKDMDEKREPKTLGPKNSLFRELLA